VNQENASKIIVHQFERFVIVDKPAGWLSVPSRMGEKDERPCMGIWLQKALEMKILPVHRLDEGVSGLMLFALDPESHRVANGWFERGDVSKRYDALLEVRPDSQKIGNGLLRWQSKLVRGKKRTFEAAHGKDSLTEAQYLGDEERDGVKLRKFHLWPRTGRSHQLRFEAAKHGMPVWGDTLYGGKEKSGGMALRATVMSLGSVNAKERMGLDERYELSGLFPSQD